MKKIANLFALFLVIPFISLAQAIGSKVSLVAVDGKTYTGTITAIQGDKYKVKYDGFDFDAWLTAGQFQLAQPNNQPVNNQVNQPQQQEKQPQQQANQVNQPKTANGKLYFRTTYAYGGGLYLSWLFFGNNGMMIQNPKHGVNPVDFNAEIADNSRNVGRYNFAGNKLQITWQNGQTASWDIEYDKGKLSAVDGGLVTEPEAVPANYRLSGQYAGSAVTENLSAVQTFVFNKDGTFTLNKFGAVIVTKLPSGSPEIITGQAESDSRGTYSIAGNTLWLNFANGEKKVAVIWIWDQGGGKRHLVINETSFPEEK